MVIVSYLLDYVACNWTLRVSSM